MRTIKNVTLVGATTVFVLAFVPTCCFSAEPLKVVPSLIQKLVDGSAKISTNKKSIVDEKGEIIAKEASSLKETVKKANGNPSVSDGKTPPTPMVVTCNYKCAIITKRCYEDANGNGACINACDKQVLLCE